MLSRVSTLVKIPCRLIPLLVLWLSMAEPGLGQSLRIAVGDAAPPVERYAAQELQKYVRRLFRFEPVTTGDRVLPTGPVVLLGGPYSNRLSATLAGNLGKTALGKDGFVLKTLRARPPVLLITGATGRGTLFGVYELVERWGVRFSLTEDIMPAQPGRFRLPVLDEVHKPAFELRFLRSQNNLAEGSAPWTLDQYRRFIDQMARLKYNGYVFSIQESGPWLDYEFRGVKRPGGDIFFGHRYRMGEDFVGKQLFPGLREFYSPVLAPARDDEERKRLGIGLAQAVIAHLKERDMLAALAFNGFLEPPIPFKKKFNEWATLPLPDPKLLEGSLYAPDPLEESGVNPKHAAWMNVFDPVARELVAVRVKALIDTYPQADYYALWISEHRAPVVDYREVYAELDRVYHFSPAFDLEKVLADPGKFPYGAQRYRNQAKGDLLLLYMAHKLFAEQKLQEQTAKPDAHLAIAGTMTELEPMLAKMLHKNMLYWAWPEYGAHAVADGIEDLVPTLKAGVPTLLEFGVQDDNTMLFPQINIQSIERIVRQTAPHGMLGFTGYTWQIRQIDLNATYLAQAAWRPDLKAEQFYTEYMPRYVGRAADKFAQALRVIEAADRDTKKRLYGFAFWKSDIIGKMSPQPREAAVGIRAQYAQALELLRQARPLAEPSQRHRIDFWARCSDLAIRYIDLGLAASDLGQLLGDSRQPGTPLTPSVKREALARTDRLLADTRALINLIVADAKHPGDLGQIAQLDYFTYKPLLDFRKELASRQ